MQSAIIIDLTEYRNRKNQQPQPQDAKTVACSDELVDAIQTLIQQMRK